MYPLASVYPLSADPPSDPDLVTHCIPDAQRDVHVVTEAAALLVVAPFMVWLATQRELPPPARVLAGGIAAATVIVDGGLLFRYLSSPQE